MFWVVTILLLAFVFLWIILYPLFGAKMPWEVGPDETALRDLRVEWERQIRMLKDLDFERESGVVGEERYRELRRAQLEQAAITRRRLDALESARGESDAI